MRKIQIHLVTFDYTIWVVVGDQAPALRFIRFKLEDETIDPTKLADRRGAIFHRDGYVPVIWLPAPPKSPRELATLAHEALHATAIVMRWACIPFSADSEEVYTHTMSAIIAETLERLRA